mgnify:CR=1 FL=1
MTIPYDAILSDKIDSGESYWLPRRAFDKNYSSSILNQRLTLSAIAEKNPVCLDMTPDMSLIVAPIASYLQTHIMIINPDEA